jgi:hypothetical protein
LPHTPSSHVLLMPNSKHLTRGISNLMSLITKTKLGLSHGRVRMARSQACATIGPNRPPPLHLQYDTVSPKNKKHSDDFFPHYHTHATAAGASTVPPARRWPSPTRQPSPTVAFLYDAACHSVSLLSRAHPAPLAPAGRARRPPPEPSPVLLAMVVVVVLARRRLRPQRLELTGPGLPHVASACFKCFRSFVGMFQVFHADVTKVDRNVAYVVMVIHVCCKCVFPMFHLFFRRTLQVCLSRYYICFTHILQVFYMDVAYVCNCFSCVFESVSDVCFECSSYFVRMLQMFHLDVLKVGRGCCACACCNVSHLPQPVLGCRAWRGAAQQAWRGVGSREAWGSGAGGPRQCVQQALTQAL